MSAIVEAKRAARTRKIYVEHPSDGSIRVPMREMELTNGECHLAYDTSGPYTDPDIGVDVRSGIAPLRSGWIEARNDTVELDRP